MLTSYPVGAVTTKAAVKFLVSINSDWLALGIPLQVKNAVVVPKVVNVGIAVRVGVVGNQFDGFPKVIIWVILPDPLEPMAKFIVLELLYSKVTRLVPEFPTVLELGVVLLKRPEFVPVGVCVNRLLFPNVYPLNALLSKYFPATPMASISQAVKWISPKVTATGLAAVPSSMNTMR